MPSLRAGLLLTLALLIATAAQADTAEPFSADGWYTWRVPSVDNAPRWCCFQWNAGRATPAACTLDARGVGYVDKPGRLPASEEIQLYAQVRDGKPVRVRALSPACPVQSDISLVDLGRVDAASSVSWLEPLARQGESEALAAIATHHGPQALSLLTDLALGGGDQELRGDAVFWLAQTGAPEAEAAIMEALRSDPSEEVRDRAVFALSQLPDDRGVDILLGLLVDRSLPMPLREQALFWLAQSDSDEAFEAIDGLLSASK